MRMAWPGRDPMAYLRGQVDEVDDDLALLLARRAALTARSRGSRRCPATPAATPSGRPRSYGGWPSTLPTCEAETLRRIMHEVIAAGLDLRGPDRSRVTGPLRRRGVSVPGGIFPPVG